MPYEREAFSLLIFYIPHLCIEIEKSDMEFIHIGFSISCCIFLGNQVLYFRQLLVIYILSASQSSIAALRLLISYRIFTSNFGSLPS